MPQGEYLQGEVIRIDVRMDNGTVVHIVTSGEMLVDTFGPPTKCNRCGRLGTALSVGATCNACGVCRGKMVADE